MCPPSDEQKICRESTESREINFSAVFCERCRLLRQSEDDGSSRRCLRRSPGIASMHGPDFEIKEASLIHLRARNKRLHHELYSNAMAATPCDDLVLGVSYPWNALIFLQLKHSKSKKGINTQALTAGSGDFSVKKYFSFFEKVFKLPRDRSNINNKDELEMVFEKYGQKNVYVVLFTTMQVDANVKKLETADVLMKHTFPWMELLHTRGGDVLQFSNENEQVWNLFENDPERSNHFRNDFLPRFFIFSGQSQSCDLYDLILQEIKIYIGTTSPSLKAVTTNFLSRTKSWASDSLIGKPLFWDEEDYSRELDDAVAEEIEDSARKSVGDELVFQDVYCQTLSQKMREPRTLRVVVPAVPSGLRAAKLLQIFTAAEYRGRWTYINKEVLKFYPKEILLSICNFRSFVIVDLDETYPTEKVEQLLKNMRPQDPQVVCILEDRATAYKLNVHGKLQTFVDDWQLSHMQEDVQDTFLDKTLSFQGTRMRLRELEGSWPRLREQVDGALLCELARGDAAVGEPPPAPSDAIRPVPHVPRAIHAARTAQAVERTAEAQWEERAVGGACAWLRRTLGCGRLAAGVCAQEGAGGAAWSERQTTLLVGEAGAGKTYFLRQQAARTRARAPDSWAVYVDLLRQRALLQRMPVDPADLNTEHALTLLAEAATVTSRPAARRFLEAAFLNGAVTVFVDGVDKVCPQSKGQVLELLRLLQKRASFLWVAARPEVELCLHRTLKCVPVQLRPISPLEQEKYLQEYWASELANGTSSPVAFAHLASEMVQALRTVGPRSLLDVPEHLHVAAVEVAPAALAALLAGRLTPTLAVNRLAIYRLVVDRKRKRFLECHGFANANVENTFVVDNYNSAFDNIHQNYAMLLLISSGVFLDMDSKPFENEVAKFKTSMIKEKTGVIWLDENGQPNFSHISFLNYFAASWIYSKLQSYQLCPLLRKACCSLYLGQRGRAECEVHEFLELMLDEGRPLHQDDPHQELEGARARV